MKVAPGGPIFVVGANRSGTTLLRLILNAHSHIAIPEELVYFKATLAGVPLQQWQKPGLSEATYRAFVRRFLEQNHVVFADLGLDRLEETILAGARDLRAPYETALEAWAQRQGKARWGEKTPSNLFYADVLLDMFPGARFIHLVRDPRAGVHSMMDTRMFRTDVVFNALNRRKYMSTGDAWLQRHVPPAQRLTLRYEDLVAEPERQIRAICDFVDEPFEQEMLLFHQNARRYMKSEAAESFNRAAMRPVDGARAERWRAEMPPAEQQVVEWICRREMDRFGYDREHGPLSPAQWLNVWPRVAYWQVQCWRHRKSPHYIVQYQMFERLRRRISGEPLPSAVRPARLS